MKFKIAALTILAASMVFAGCGPHRRPTGVYVAPPAPVVNHPPRSLTVTYYRYDGVFMTEFVTIYWYESVSCYGWYDSWGYFHTWCE